MTPVNITDEPGNGTFSHLDSPRETRRITTGSASADGNPVTVTKTTVGSMDNDCYLISAGPDALLVDASADAEHLLALADTLGVRITDVLTTHRHFDHVGALEDVLAATGARHHASVQDAPELPAAVDVTWGHDPDSDSAEQFTTSSEALGALDLKLILLRGHTEGGLALVTTLSDGTTHLFPGDSLFPGGVGKTFSPELFTRLLDDVENRCFVLPDSTAVHPGHGDDTTIGAERPHLGEWRDRGW